MIPTVPRPRRSEPAAPDQSVPFSIRMLGSLYNELNALSDEHGRTLNAEILFILDSYLVDHRVGPTMELPQWTADQVVDEIKRQFNIVASRGRRPQMIEMSEQYAGQLDAKFLRGNVVTIAINEPDVPAFGGVPVRRVSVPGVLRVVMT